MAAVPRPPRRPARQHGLNHVMAAARYSLAGLRRLMAETAARHEALAAGGLLVVFLWRGVGLGQTLGLLMIFLAVLAIEALNTAIEVLADRVSPEWSVAARDAKDLGSLAVALLLAVGGIYALRALLVPG